MGFFLGGHLSRLAWGGLKPGSPNLSGVPWPPVASRGFCAHRPPPRTLLGTPRVSQTQAGHYPCATHPSSLPSLDLLSAGAEPRGQGREGCPRVPLIAPSPAHASPVLGFTAGLSPPLAVFGRMPTPLEAPHGAAVTPRVGPAGRGAPMGAPMNPKMLQGMGPSLPGLDPLSTSLLQPPSAPQGWAELIRFLPPLHEPLLGLRVIFFGGSPAAGSRTGSSFPSSPPSPCLLRRADFSFPWAGEGTEGGFAGIWKPFPLISCITLF